jgi:hypothetical protein
MSASYLRSSFVDKMTAISISVTHRFTGIQAQKCYQFVIFLGQIYAASIRDLSFCRLNRRPASFAVLIDAATGPIRS